VCGIVAVYAILLIQSWVLADVLDIDCGLRCECGSSVRSA
jgi:hypothetical protein